MSLAYRDNVVDEWKEIAHAVEIRKLKCTFGSPKVRGFAGTGGGEVWECGGTCPLPFPEARVQS